MPKMSLRLGSQRSPDPLTGFGGRFAVGDGKVREENTLCSKKSDAKIQITITTAYLIRIKYPLSGFNWHLSDVNIANFNKIHRTVSEQQLF